MNDKRKYGDENPDEDLRDSESFESGRDLGEFSDDEDPREFDSEEERENYLTDFGDESEYSDLPSQKVGFFDRLLSLPKVSILWPVLFLAAVAALFFLFYDAERYSAKKQVMEIDQRVKSLEYQLAEIAKPAENTEQVNADLAMVREATDRVGNLERTLTARTDQLKKEIESLQTALAEIRAKGTDQKGAVAKKSATVQQTAKKSSGISYHTVSSGENLFRIALKYGLKQDELLRLNNLEKNAVIKPGQKLRVSR